MYFFKKLKRLFYAPLFEQESCKLLDSLLLRLKVWSVFSVLFAMIHILYKNLHLYMLHKSLRALFLKICKIRIRQMKYSSLKVLPSCVFGAVISNYHYFWKEHWVVRVVSEVHWHGDQYSLVVSQKKFVVKNLCFISRPKLHNICEKRRK